jgi:hypothetical protein
MKAELLLGMRNLFLEKRRYRIESIGLIELSSIQQMETARIAHAPDHENAVTPPVVNLKRTSARSPVRSTKLRFRHP